MNKIRYCAFNMDTVCVEVFFADGTQVSIYTPAVDTQLDITMKQQAEVDWLIYNKPWEYASLILSGDMMGYLSGRAEHCLQD